MRNVGFEIVYFAFIELVLYWKKKKKACLCIFISSDVLNKAPLDFLTDHGDEILDNCANNVHLNSEMFNHQASVYVRELNWKNSWPPTMDSESSETQKR